MDVDEPEARREAFDDSDRPQKRQRIDAEPGDDGEARGAASSPPPAGPSTPAYSLKYIIKGHKKAISSVRFSPDGKFLASAAADTPIHIYSLPSFSLYRTLTSHTEGISDISFSADSTLLASASDDRTVRIWEVTASPAATDNAARNPERSVRVLHGHLSAVFCVAWHPRGDLVASGGMDETVRVWDVQKGKCMRVLPAHSDAVSGVQFNRDGTIIVSCSWDGYMSNVFFSPNSKFLFASTLDSTIRLWDFHTDKTLKTYVGHDNRKFCISSTLTPSGKYLVTGSENHKLVLWDIQTREIVQSIEEAHRDAIMAIASHPKKRVLASAGLEKDPTIRIWFDEGEELEGLADEEEVDRLLNGAAVNGHGGVNGEGMDVEAEVREIPRYISPNL
ncbi:WD repeat domain 5 [Pseudohyphozyma bogoriensis]|nr:WD repeat domain 5 [Pseudohyphozyma bogoriensis]